MPKELPIDPLDGVKSGRSGRRGAQRDAVHRASAATHQMDGFGPPKAGFSRPPDVVMLHLWSARPRREACLAGKREKSVKRVNIQFLGYKPFGCRTAAAGLWCRAHIEDIQPALFVFAHRCPQCLTQ
jgi:hypothetical protein